MLTDLDLVAEMKRLSSMYPTWMNKASFEQAQTFRKHVADAAKLAMRPAKKVSEWRMRCRGKIGDFAALRSEIETRFTDNP